MQGEYRAFHQMAVERGRSTVKRLVVGVLVPAVVAFGALVAVAAPASARPPPRPRRVRLLSRSRSPVRP